MLQEIDARYDRNGNITSGRTWSVAGLITNGVDVNGVQAGDHGLVAMAYDPLLTRSTFTSAANTIYLVGLYLRRQRTASQIWYIVNAAGATPTAGANNVGIYNAAGTLLGSVNVDSKISANGPQFGSLGSAVTVPAGLNWVAMQFQATTQPGIGRIDTAQLGTFTLNQAAANYRFATNGSGTTLPASITPSSNSTTGSAALWAGIA